MSHMEVGIIPCVPLVVSGNRPASIYCTTDGKRVVYGTATGVVSRMLPDQMDVRSRLVEMFSGSKRPIEVAAISPDGNVIAGGDSNGTIYVWSMSREGATLKVHSLGMQYVRITDLSFSDDSQRLAVVGVDKYTKKLGVCIFTDAGSAVGKLEGHTLGIHSVSFRKKKPYLIATAGLDGLVCLHSGPPFKLLHKGDGHGGRANCVRFSPCGEHLVSCGDDGKVVAWSLRNGEVERSIPVSEHPLLNLAWSADSARIVTVGVDRRIRIVQFDTGAIVDETIVFCTSPETPVGVSWTVSDWIVATTSTGNLWGIKTQHQAKLALDVYFAWQGLFGPPSIIAASTSHSGRLIVGDQLGTILFLSGQDAEPRAVNSFKLPAPASIRDIAVARDKAAVVSGDGTIRLLKILDDQERPRILTQEEMGQLASTPFKDTTKPLRPPSTPGASSVRSVRQYEDGTVDVLSTGSGILVSNAEDGLWVATHQFKDGPVAICSIDDGNAAVVFCANGCIYAYPFATAGYDFTPLWSTRIEGTITGATATIDGTLVAVAVTADAKYPLDKFGDGRTTMGASPYLIEIYEIDDTTLEGFRFVCVYELHAAEVTSIALSPTGAYLASADTNKNIYVVEIETGNRLITDEWRYHTSKISCLAWSPDGTKLISGSLDRDAYVWDTENKTRKFHIKDAHPGGVTCAQFVFNNVVLTGGSDGVLLCTELFLEGPPPA